MRTEAGRDTSPPISSLAVLVVLRHSLLPTPGSTPRNGVARLTVYNALLGAGRQDVTDRIAFFAGDIGGKEGRLRDGIEIGPQIREVCIG
ncbi:hypothetical protein EJ06DRAFT_526000 [Trichodelitschia bisporula]|uniref:Uncharacterized protein n=1 Tax=Trichodelitschia bisporula TaxID=703511 RepID=A0A6G1IBJ4_9PEZI|nr:hypothetical protein EJ06DRAFT_526000 [Trichodelitschia bisporula]